MSTDINTDIVILDNRLKLAEEKVEAAYRLLLEKCEKLEKYIITMEKNTETINHYKEIEIQPVKFIEPPKVKIEIQSTPIHNKLEIPKKYSTIKDFFLEDFIVNNNYYVSNLQEYITNNSIGETVFNTLAVKSHKKHLDFMNLVKTSAANYKKINGL